MNFKQYFILMITIPMLITVTYLLSKFKGNKNGIST